MRRLKFKVQWVVFLQIEIPGNLIRRFSLPLAHRQLQSQLKLLILEELADLTGDGHGHQAPHKVVTGNVHHILPARDKGRIVRLERTSCNSSVFCM